MSSNNSLRRVLLIRPEYSAHFAGRSLLSTEPLDLEYLAAVAKEEGVEYRIHDPMVTGLSFSHVFNEFRPDIVAITGYYPAKDRMLEYAALSKQMSGGQVTTVIGGVHAELNYEDFYCDDVDLIAHSGGCETFRRLVRVLNSGKPLSGLDGTCWQEADRGWVCGERMPLDLSHQPLPDREHFYKYLGKFAYLHYGPVALVRSAAGCPFTCNFCYCRLLNGGKYVMRQVAEVVAEIKEVKCGRIWIIDDTFLVDVERVRDFAEQLKQARVRKEFIIYGRAEFIANNPDVVGVLKEMGVINIIIGFESVDEKILEDYNKLTSEMQSRRCIELLKDCGIECSALFIMDVDATMRDFRRLGNWISSVGLTTYTLSIFSPYPGTGYYEKYQDRFDTSDCRKWDLSHLVMKPGGMIRPLYYCMMFWMHIKVLFINRAIRNHVFRRCFGRRAINER